MIFMKGLMDEGATDKVDGWLAGRFLNVPKVILPGTGQISVYGRWAQDSFFNSDHLAFV